jgi:hypothetical protein
MVKIARFAEFIFEAINPLRIQDKDLMRIRDIIRKANGSQSKAIQLTSQQAHMITDKAKAYRRYQAALEVGGPFPDITAIFKARFEELSGEVLGGSRRRAGRSPDRQIEAPATPAAAPAPATPPATRPVQRASSAPIRVKKTNFQNMLTGSPDEAPTQKDVWRIKDLVERGGGIDSEQTLGLAKTQATGLTDKNKAIRRAKAAENQGLDEIAAIFYKRAQEI